jgi:ribonuclease BN (tRNA processing enzyme)
MSHLEQAYEYDIRIRLYDDRASPDGVVILAEDIGEGVVHEKGGVKITAFEVDHTPVKPAFGYRIDHAGRSVVLSGDTRVSDNLIRHAQGVDLLVHEVASPETFQRAGTPPERAKSVVAHHVTPEQAGDVFSRTKPKLAVYSAHCPADRHRAGSDPADAKDLLGASGGWRGSHGDHRWGESRGSSAWPRLTISQRLEPTGSVRGA